MRIFRSIALLIVLSQFSCDHIEKEKLTIKIQAFDLDLHNNLRGLSLAGDSVIWISGVNGVFITSNNRGKSWKIDSIGGAQHLDFRSVKTFDDKTAILVSAGTPARVYKTIDGGKSWTITWSSVDPAVFLDGVYFWDKNHGLIMGDPVNGHLFILKTSNGGEKWIRIPPQIIPESLPSEGGFAASGTCIVGDGKQNAWLGTGGDSARVYRTLNRGKIWSVSNTPILCGGQMKGIYSLSFKNATDGIAVGGEWNIAEPMKSKAYTNDGGRTWTLGRGTDSYCSGSAYLKNDIYLACGQSGIDITYDGGKTWEKINDLHLYGMAFFPDGVTGFGTGPGGRIVKLVLGDAK
nr:oxidoreductase [Bacteroidota bacterium]